MKESEVMSVVSHVWLFVILWTVAHQAPLSLEFSRQEYWSDCHSLLQGIFLTQGSSLGLTHCRQFLYHLIHQGSPNLIRLIHICSCPIQTDYSWKKIVKKLPFQLIRLWRLLESCKFGRLHFTCCVLYLQIENLGTLWNCVQCIVL